MAFWGVEVKPGNPIRHSCVKAGRRLRISQATLGIGKATNKTIVQCNVGRRSPVLLCALLPEKVESCHLDLEFAEADDVVFSVIGPRTVYLTGYFVSARHSAQQSDSESFGEDIQNSYSGEDSYSGDNDEYGGSFIDDGEIQVLPPSPLSSDKAMDESDPEGDSKHKARKCLLKPLRKKNTIVISDTESDDDDDGYLLKVFSNKKQPLKKTTISKVQAPKARVTAQKGADGRGVKLLLNEKKEVPKEVVTFKETTVSKDKVLLTDGKIQEDTENANTVNQTIPASDINIQVDTGEQKKKRKEHSEKEEKIGEVEIDIAVGEEKEYEVEASKNMEIGASGLVLPQELGSNGGQKSKKKRKEVQVQGTSTEQGDKTDQGLLGTDSSMKDLPEASGIYMEQNTSSEPEKKKKKKTKKKTQDEDQVTTEIMRSNNKMTLSNGVSIEVLANGPPEGKVAAAGKKVKIYYTAMLKETGDVFDANVGKTALKFRLGDEDVVEGLNTGMDGMHVGEKRRLLIPPSMGLKEHAEKVPNSWLVYDVELAGVHR